MVNKKVVVASGKGGTGKTLIATSLALLLDSVTFVDCDVEEPNSHIFLSPSIDKETPAKKMVPAVDTSKCDLCKKCQEVCQFGALAVTKTKVLSFPELCHSCYACLEMCPRGAIYENFREIGKLKLGSFERGKFISGRLNIGEPMATPVIKKLKEIAEKERGIVIFDAPPGSSCPVVETLKNCDYAILVSEPTPFGIHDVSIVIEIIKDIGIDGGLIINRKTKEDSFYRDLRALADKNGIKILGEIPLDREIARFYSSGKTLFHNEKYRKTLERVAEEVLK